MDGLLVVYLMPFSGTFMFHVHVMKCEFKTIKNLNESYEWCEWPLVLCLTIIVLAVEVGY
jgi:hypothetical protein